jgi:LysM repeat protein
MFLLAMAPEKALAQNYLSVQVQRGDTLAKIAGRYCTSWQTIYDINRQTIGPNPNALIVGMALTVPANCGGGGGNSGGNPNGVYDRGPSTHASGSFNPPYYTVAWGDTIFSITKRFGISEGALRQANNLYGSLQTGQVLTIPFMTNLPQPPSPQQPQPPAANGERVFFNGGVSANRVGVIVRGAPKRYVLGARAGQVMEIGTRSHGEALMVTVTTASGRALSLNNPNGGVENNLWLDLPVSGDYVVTVSPVRLPEGPELNFDVTFIIQ